MNKDKKPLLSSEQFYDSVNGISYAPLSFAKAYAKYHTEWHLKNVKEFVADNAKIDYVRVVSEDLEIIDKQSITNAVDKYINENL